MAISPEHKNFVNTNLKNIINALLIGARKLTSTSFGNSSVINFNSFEAMVVSTGKRKFGSNSSENEVVTSSAFILKRGAIPSIEKIPMAIMIIHQHAL